MSTFRSGLAVLLVGSLSILAAPGVAGAAPKASGLSAVYGVGAKRAAYVSGSVAVAPKGARAVLQTRAGKGGVVRVAGKIRAGRFSLKWTYPKRTKTLRVRAAVLSKRGTKALVAGQWQEFQVAKLPPAPTIAKVKASAVTAVPAPGQAGTLAVQGKPNIEVGDIIALGASSQTPDGLLAKATAVTVSAAGTSVATQPASLPEALPTGSIDLQVTDASLPQTATTAALGPNSPFRKAFSCQNSQTMSAEGSVTLSAGVTMQASWGPFSGVKARFEGKVSAAAHLGASVSGSASCELTKSQLFAAPVALGTYAFSVGPVPVVLKPQVQVYLSATAEAHAEIKTSLDASMSANAGVAYQDGEFTSFGGLTPSMTYQPPTLSAGGTAQVTLTPTLDVLLYGVAGPRVDLTAGLKLSADSNANPWWKLTAPIDLGAQLRMDVWKVSLASPRFSIFSAEPQLATADGPLPDALRPKPPVTNTPAPTPNPNPNPDPAPTPAPNSSPTVSVTKGGSAQGQPGCTSSACAYVQITFDRFPAGNHTVTCRASGEEGGYYSYAASGTSGNSATCYYGFPGREVWATVDDVQSNRVVW
ncbi:MAG: hypothetical protein Q7T55_13930 [Solirubrobacteraceae bacterium]|nr:hypothetical protein [Solirubrobacteraceae bacterium]